MDPIQTSSSLPLPQHQTTQGSHDPLPLGGHEQAARETTATATAAHQSSTENFEAYLNTSTITRLVNEQANSRYDAAQAIRNASVYKDPGQSTPI